jgi:hypothetical protein
MILLLTDMLIWPPSLRTLPQFIFILLDIFVQYDLRKYVSFRKKMFFKMDMMKGCHPYHLWARWSGTPWFGTTLRWWLIWVRCEHEGLSLSPKDRLSSLLIYTLIKYNHSRLYGQSLDLNLYGLYPRVMLRTCSQMLWVKNKATQMLMVKGLRLPKHYLPQDIMIFRWRS